MFPGDKNSGTTPQNTKTLAVLLAEGGRGKKEKKGNKERQKNRNDENRDVAKSGYLSNHLNSGPMRMDTNADTYADGMMLVLCRCTSR
jgi:hypothetical protein